MRPRRETTLRSWALVAAVLGLLAWQPSCAGGQPGRQSPATQPASTRGAELYARYCAACHGRDGRGEPSVSELFYPHIRDFSTGEFHLVSTVNGVPTDLDLISVIGNGMPGSAMPPYGWMPEENLASLAAHVRHLAVEGLVTEIRSRASMLGQTMTEQQAREEAVQRMDPGAPVPLGPVLEPTPEVLDLGARLYLENCAACHGLDARGRSAFTWPNLVNIPFARDLTEGILRGGTSAEAIETRIRAGMPGSTMPPTHLGPEETAALVAFVRSLIPEGAAERYAQHQEVVGARRVDAVPTAPEDPRWNDGTEVRIVLAPMWWRDGSVTEVHACVLHDGESLALRLRWPDSTRDDRALGGLRSDGAALQLTSDVEPPVFGMGSPGHTVNIWHWKAFRPDDTLGLADFLESRIHGGGVSDVPIYAPAPGVARPRTEGEDLRVRGIPSVAGADRDQTILAVPSWANDEWQVVFSRKLGTTDESIDLEPGHQVLLAFAIWNGGAGDSGGQKSISIWHRLDIER